jgi:serine/threonine protein kinase
MDRHSFKLIMRESWFLRQLKHPNIAQLLHQYVSPNSAPNDRHPTFYFVQEDCGQTLLTYLRKRMLHSTVSNHLLVPVGDIERILEGLLSALVYLENVGILHRDIKEDNCLLLGGEGDFVAKLIDFGLAKRFSMNESNLLAPAQWWHDEQGFELFMSQGETAGARGELDVQSKKVCCPTQYAPEAFEGGSDLVPNSQFCHKSDLWAVGTMILWPLLFWACRKNFANSYGPPLLLSARKFPFWKLWKNSPPCAPLFSHGTPRAYTVTDLGNIIKDELGDAFVPQDPASDDALRFGKLCGLLQRMCACSTKRLFMFDSYGQVLAQSKGSPYCPRVSRYSYRTGLVAYRWMRSFN